MLNVKNPISATKASSAGSFPLWEALLRSRKGRLQFFRETWDMQRILPWYGHTGQVDR